MRKTMRVRLAVFLSIMMILPAIAAVLPMTAMEVSAASNELYFQWSWSSEYGTIEVEKGQKFYIGDYANITVYGKSPWSGKASMVKGVSYSSSDKSVAKISSKGYLETKKTGTTKITLKYKGKKLKTYIKVVPKGTFQTSKVASNLKKKAEKIAKKIPSKITTKNGFELYKLTTDYRLYIQDSDEINSNGFSKTKVSNTTTNSNGSTTTYSYYKLTNQLVVPQAGRYDVLYSMLLDYGWKNNPTGTTGAKLLKIKSVSAKTNAITVKLKKKVDTTQVLAARIYTYGVDNEKISGNKKAYTSVYVYDVKTQDSYRCKAELKVGSSTLKLVPQTYSYQKGKWVTTKLKKGHTYRLETKDYWSKGKTVKVK